VLVLRALFLTAALWGAFPDLSSALDLNEPVAVKVLLLA